jgi:hypothetical protein
VERPDRGWLFLDWFLIEKYIGWPCWWGVAALTVLVPAVLSRVLSGTAVTLVVPSTAFAVLVFCAVRRARARRDPGR